MCREEERLARRKVGVAQNTMPVSYRAGQKGWAAATSWLRSVHNELIELIAEVCWVRTALLRCWRHCDCLGEIRVDFTGQASKLLGDLHQELSEHARETSAPFHKLAGGPILDLALGPALGKFTRRGLRTIVHGCSRNAIHRPTFRWRAGLGTALSYQIHLPLEPAYGFRQNPSVVTISPCRPLVADLQSAETLRLEQARDSRSISPLVTRLFYRYGCRLRASAGQQGNYAPEHPDKFIRSHMQLECSRGEYGGTN